MNPQLPMYGNPYPPKDVIMNQEAGAIEEGVRSARHALLPLYAASIAGLERGQELMDTAVSHSRTTYEMITDESQAIPRAIAITTGGLFGLLLASRKGFFKKILYTGFGLTAATAVCYPQQSKELTELSIYIAKKKGPEMIQEYTGYDLKPYLSNLGSKKPSQ